MMNRLILEPWEVSNVRTILPASDRRAQYARDFIWRQKPGKTLRVGVVDRGICDECRAYLNDDGGLVLATGGDVYAKLINTTAVRPALDLILALPAPLRLKRMLPVISMLGVDRLILCGTAQSDKTYFGSILLRGMQRYNGQKGPVAEAQDTTGDLRSLLIEGAEQSGFTVIPKLALCSNLRTALACVNQSDTLKFAAHPDRGPDYSVLWEKKNGESELVTIPRPVSIPNVFDHHDASKEYLRAVLAVGPERGWEEPSEIRYLINSGFDLVTLGPRTLRTDVALTSLLALVHDRLPCNHDYELMTSL